MQSIISSFFPLSRPFSARLNSIGFLLFGMMQFAPGEALVSTHDVVAPPVPTVQTSYFTRARAHKKKKKKKKTVQTPCRREFLLSVFFIKKTP
jgi:hypothetical protein